MKCVGEAAMRHFRLDPKVAGAAWLGLGLGLFLESPVLPQLHTPTQKRAQVSSGQPLVQPSSVLIWGEGVGLCLALGSLLFGLWVHKHLATIFSEELRQGFTALSVRRAGWKAHRALVAETTGSCSSSSVARGFLKKLRSRSFSRSKLPLVIPAAAPKESPLLTPLFQSSLSQRAT